MDGSSSLNKKSHSLFRWRRQLRDLVSKRPGLYFPIARILGRKFLVSEKTELVIEGFPRSANSFAEAAFRLAQARPVDLAHHSHAAAQVIRAVRLRVPTLVLFRNPDDAIVSLLMMRSNPYQPIDAYREYVSFYRRIMPYRSGYVLASFESATSRFGAVTRQLNQHFGANFREFENSQQMVQEVYKLVDRLTLERIGVEKTNYSPDQSKEDRQVIAARREEIRKQVMNPGLAKTRSEAQEVFEQLRAMADL